MSDSAVLQKVRFDFACWSAARAAQRGISGLTVDVCCQLIGSAESLKSISFGLPNLPRPEDFDAQHEAWREAIVRNAVTGVWGKAVEVGHGVAAKLINVYLKVLCLSAFDETRGGTHSPTILMVHPPIDRRLLLALSAHDPDRSKEWKQLKDTGWRTFSSKDYADAICLVDGWVKAQNGTVGRWQIERYWSPKER